jgi:hypothetical protein
MKRSTIRLGLSLMLAMGWWVQRLPAQTPAAPLPAHSAPCHCASVLDPDAPPGPQRKTFTVRALNHFGLCCASSHNQPTCGNLHSELTFIFGSCRQFFGEPCLPPPPHGVPPAAIYGR